MPSNGRRLAEQPANAELPQPLPSLLSLDGSLLVDVRGAARLVDLSPRSLYKLISKGEFPKGRPYPSIVDDDGKEAVMRRLAWRVDDIAAWIDQHFPRQVDQ
jgi:predicted DNA-binding transcriptional regulator AlpA